MMTPRRSLSRVVGFLLVIMGFALICFLPSEVVYGGLFVQVAYIWAVSMFVGIGALLIVHVPLSQIAEAFLIVSALGAPWILLFFIPLPNEIRLWPAVIIALITVLIYRYYRRKRDSSV